MKRSSIISVNSEYARFLRTCSNTETMDLSPFRTHLCNYDLNLTYPQTGGHFPTLLSPFHVTFDSRVVFGGPRASARFDLNYLSRANFISEFVKRSEREDSHTKVKRQRQQQLTLAQWKRDHLNKKTLDEDYGCFLWEEMTDFATNFTFPWCKCFLVFVIIRELNCISSTYSSGRIRRTFSQLSTAPSHN